MLFTVAPNREVAVHMATVSALKEAAVCHKGNIATLTDLEARIIDPNHPKKPSPECEP